MRREERDVPEQRQLRSPRHAGLARSGEAGQHGTRGPQPQGPRQRVAGSDREHPPTQVRGSKDLQYHGL